MLIRKAYKFQRRPNGGQERLLRSFAGSCRYVHNRALALQRGRLENSGEIRRYGGLTKTLTQWRHDAETSWLSESPCHPLQQSLKDPGRAFDNFFAERAEFPKFKRKGGGESFRDPAAKQFHLHQGNVRIFLPKGGWVRYRHSQDVVGIPKNVTVSERCGKGYVSIQVETERQLPRHPGGSVGLDVGLVRFVTRSDGTRHEPLNSFRKHEATVRKAQQSPSRKRRGSTDRRKRKQRLNRIHTRIADTRHDCLHHISTPIGKNHAMVVVEDLAIANMSQAAKGTLDRPGRNVRAKSGLNKAILDQGWGVPPSVGIQNHMERRDVGSGPTTRHQ